MGDERRIERAAIVASGEELVRGAIVDTNSSHVVRWLRARGIRTLEVRVVGDGEAEIARAVKELAASVDLVVVTGGLGPTEDDRTREALAAAAGVALVHDAQAATQVAAYFARLGRTPSPSNGKQELAPAGAVVLRNPIGSAPGLEIRIGAARVVALPGVPRELFAQLEQVVGPRLEGERPARGLAQAVLKLSGIPESVAGERIAEWMRARPPLVSVTVQSGTVTVHAEDDDDEAGRARLAGCLSAMKATLGDHVYAERDVSLAEHVVERLSSRRETIAVAESCTGGLLCAALTDVPGASKVLREGFVTYSDAAKMRALGVDEALLLQHGAVSEPVARAMAERALSLASTTFGVGITGIAGPDGGTEAKPVGLVHLALAGALATRHVSRIFPGDRDTVRRLSVGAALELLRRAMS